MATGKGKAGSQSDLTERNGMLTAPAHLSAANVKPRYGSRSYERAKEKAREWLPDRQHLLWSEC